MYIVFASNISPPQVNNIDVGEVVQISETHFELGDNWLKKNDFGIWEMYIEGAPYERGLIYGKLAKNLIQKQEEIFVNQINDFVPSEIAQQFLRLMLGFFNKDLPDNIPLENQQEIYGISQSFSNEFNYIAPKYDRILNYHAAHDIGHALNDYSLVGCTSFAIKEEKTKDGNLLVGRNFDFYVGDEFAKEKLIVFVNPDNGYGFSSYSWAGFTGVVSGLNTEGLSVTINASKSDLPTSSKTPISILAREILQYASTIQEAITIAEQRSTFVSETILVSSGKENRAVLIEKSPSKMGVYESASNTLVCANHFQSDQFIQDKVNIENIKESDSKHRFDRVQYLLKKDSIVNVPKATGILRDQGTNEKIELGIGNPKAINQLIAHHSIVIKPASRVFYISTHDYQLGEYIAYDLDEILRSKEVVHYVDTVPSDPFLETSDYKNYLKYREIRQKISDYVNLGINLNLNDKEIKTFISLNPELYITYEMIGRYYSEKNNNDLAVNYFSKALSKNVASEKIRKEFESLINELKRTP